MKKIIGISIVTSVLLFSANVDKLTLDLKNTVVGSKVNAATVSQGETQILGDSNIENLSISKKTKGNVISDTLINSASDTNFNLEDFEETEYYDRERDETIVSQGRTIIINGKVSNSKITSDNIIDNETTINTALGNSVQIDQGFTLIEGVGQEAINMKIDSENYLSGVDIEGDGTGETDIKQANFIMEDDGSASKAIDVTLKSKNIIDGGKIGHADIKQAFTELEEGATLQYSTLTQANTISGETEIKEFSEISQGTTEIEESSIATIQQDVENIITDVEGESSSAKDSKVVQADIHIEDNSKVSLVFQEHSNELRDAKLQDSSITQDTLNVIENSVVGNFRQQADNSAIKVELKDSTITQNNVLIKNSTLDDSDASVSIQKNSISDSTLTDSYITQADVAISDSTVLGLSVSEQNKIDSANFSNTNLTQGKLVISGI